MKELFRVKISDKRQFAAWEVKALECYEFTPVSIQQLTLLKIPLVITEVIEGVDEDCLVVDHANSY